MELRYNLLNFVLQPFGASLWLFLSIWLLTSSADLYFNSIHGLPLFGCYMACHGFILAYIIVLIVQMLPGIIGKVIQSILLFLGIINMIADTFTHSIMHFGFTNRMVQVIVATTPAEASEFLPMYFTTEVCLFISVNLFTLGLIHFIHKHYPFSMKKWISYALFAILAIFSCTVFLRKSNNWEGLFLMKIKTFSQYETPEDLTLYRSSPILIDKGPHPENVVLIIGESLSRSHCSLYGYEKCTQPNLGEMMRDSMLIVFSNPQSPYTHTSESLKSILSSYKTSQQDEGKWFENKIFLMDAMSSAGYQTNWISNQSSAGLYDNVVTRLALLADNVCWSTDKGFGYWKYEYDEVVLPIIDSMIVKSVSKSFAVIHLMGNHEEFTLRYPQQFSIFKSKDYPFLAESQRQLIAEYDNSVLYNDYVVSSIFKRFDETNSIIIYISDHALDLYVSDPSFCGHARNDYVSFSEGLKIPMIVYPTKKYTEENKYIVDELAKLSSANYLTEDIMYLILYVANYAFANSDCQFQ